MAEIKNLRKTARKIKESIDRNFVLVSDVDLDGVTSLIILEEIIKNLGGKISLSYFPDRNKIGYGIEEKTLEYLKDFAPGILIFSDYGTAEFEKIRKFQKMGFEVVIIDHHEPLRKIPPVDFLVNPKQPSDRYPFKSLAACGLCFKLAEIALKGDFKGRMKNNLLELAALGTFADMMPRKEDNKDIMEKGLEIIPLSSRPAFRVFLKKFPLSEYSIKEVLQKMVSVSQVSEIKDNLAESYLFLSASSLKEAEIILERLLEKSGKRKKITADLVDLFSQRIEEDQKFIFQGSSETPFSLTGSLASRLSSKFKKPTFIFGEKGKRAVGSIRTPKEINSLEALKKCSRLFITFGGHPQASGFTIESKNLDKLKKCLEKYFQKI